MNKKHISQLVIGLVTGALLGYLGVKAGRLLAISVPMDTLPEKIAGAFILLFSAWFALAFHELAHLCTGLWQGFRFHLYVVGFLGIRRRPDTEAIQWYWNNDPQLFGGVAATMPVQEYPDLTSRFARVVIAGPLGSLLLTLVAGAAGWALHGTSSTGGRYLLLFLFTAAATSLLFFLATTLPSRTGMFFTDRARFFRLISGGKTADIERAMLELVAYTQAGKPLEQLNMANVELVRQDPDYAVYADFYAFSHHLALGQEEQALAVAKRLENLPEGMPAVFRAEFWKELCFAAAFLQNDVQAANAWWQKIEKQLAKRQDVPVLRLKAALQKVNGNASEARRLALQGLSLLNRKQALNANEQLERRLLGVLAG